MKQRIIHGATIDATTPEEVAAIVVEAFQRYPVEHYQRRPGIIQLSATGAFSGVVETIGAQFAWRIERITIGGPGAVSAMVAIFMNDATSDDNLLEIISLGTAGRYSDSFDNTLYVPPLSQLWFTVTGGAASVNLTYNLQIKLIPAAKVR